MRRPFWIMFGCIIIAFLLDRLSRALAFHSGIKTLIPGFLESKPTMNPGIALGIQLPVWALWLILIILVLVVAAVIRETQRTQHRGQFLAAGLIFAGALSNILDRLRYGLVRDFLHFSFLPTIGNLGDWMITLGAIGLLITFRKKRAPPG
jgi:signal peptidase II